MKGIMSLGNAANVDAIYVLLLFWTFSLTHLMNHDWAWSVWAPLPMLFYLQSTEFYFWSCYVMILCWECMLELYLCGAIVVWWAHNGWR